MKFKVTARLGALGDKTGPAIAWRWSPPGQGPRFLAALGLLLLLLLRRNRCWQALWVAVPLAVNLALTAGIAALMGTESDQGDEALAVLSSLAFGLAAVWLLSPYLKGGTRWRTFLGVLVTLEVAALGASLLGGFGNREGGFANILIAVAVFALLFSAVLNLAGWSSRRRSGWLPLLLWLFAWLVATLLVLFAVMSVWLGHGNLFEMATALLLAATICFGFMSPFLLLSFNNAFYGERLKELLRLPDRVSAQPLAAEPIPATVAPPGQ